MAIIMGKGCIEAIYGLMVWKGLIVKYITSLSVCQVARATGEAKCHGSKLHKEVTEIKVYWFVCLNTFKFAKSKNGLFET